MAGGPRALHLRTWRDPAVAVAELLVRPPPPRSASASISTTTTATGGPLSPLCFDAVTLPAPFAVTNRGVAAWDDVTGFVTGLPDHPESQSFPHVSVLFASPHLHRLFLYFTIQYSLLILFKFLVFPRDAHRLLDFYVLVSSLRSRGPPLGSDQTPGRKRPLRGRRNHTDNSIR